MGRVGKQRFRPSPRTWSAVPAAGTAGRAHPLSDTDPETPGTHRSDHAHRPPRLSGAHCPELRPTGLPRGRSPAPSLAQKLDSGQRPA